MVNATSLNKTFNEVKTVVSLGNGTSTGGTDTLLATDSGKIHLINHNHASAHTINLPAMAAGLTFKFIFITDMTAAGTLVINSADNTAGDFSGMILEQITGGSNADSATVVIGSHDILTFNDDIDPGSWVEAVCDGSTWHWTGVLSVSALALVVSST